MNAMDSMKELARVNPEAGRALVDAVRAAIEAAPKPSRLTWGQIWVRQQATWRKPKEVRDAVGD